MCTLGIFSNGTFDRRGKRVRIFRPVVFSGTNMLIDNYSREVLFWQKCIQMSPLEVQEQLLSLANFNLVIVTSLFLCPYLTQLIVSTLSCSFLSISSTVHIKHSTQFTLSPDYCSRNISLNFFHLLPKET
jgi:hypothetical protein